MAEGTRQPATALSPKHCENLSLQRAGLPMPPLASPGLSWPQTQLCTCPRVGARRSQRAAEKCVQLVKVPWDPWVCKGHGRYSFFYHCDSLSSLHFCWWRTYWSWQVKVKCSYLPFKTLALQQRFR